jgi:hypothetical protein
MWGKFFSLIFILNLFTMEQIIGDYKQFVVLERVMLDMLLKRADELSEMSDAYSGVRATEIRNVVNFIKDNNIYNKDFKFKS